MTKYLRILSLIIVSVLFLTACGAADRQETQTPTPEKQTEDASSGTPTPDTPTAAQSNEPPTPTGTPTPTETPTPTQTPRTPVNELSEYFKDTEEPLYMPLSTAEQSVYLRDQAKELLSIVCTNGGEPGGDSSKAVVITDEPEEDLTGKKQIRFDTLSGGDPRAYRLSLSEKVLTVSTGSDYAAGLLNKHLPSLLSLEDLSLPYDYTPTDGPQIGFLRVASFNIQNGAGTAHDMTKLARAIKEAKVDIVGLQEVDQNTKRNLNQDTMKELSDATGLKYYGFSKAIDYNGGEYGTGILSRYPIESYKTTALPGGGEKRSFGHAVIDINGTKIDFFNTHLTLNDDQRDLQWNVIAPIYLSSPLAILTGDLNRDGTEDYDKYFKDCNYVNGNNLIGFAEGCTITKGASGADTAAQEQIVRDVYALKNGQSLDGTYTLTGKITGVVNIYDDPSIVTFRIIVGGLSDMTIKCFKASTEGIDSLKVGDIVTVTGTLRNLTTKNDHTADVAWYDSCPGYGALDNIISSPGFTQLDYGMLTGKRRYSDHNLLWADLAYPITVKEN